eukprot:2826682-Prymnesium_polylepis.1
MPQQTSACEKRLLHRTSNPRCRGSVRSAISAPSRAILIVPSLSFHIRLRVLCGVGRDGSLLWLGGYREPDPAAAVETEKADAAVAPGNIRLAGR